MKNEENITPAPLSLNHDMRPIYRALYEKYKDGYPLVVIFNALENNQYIEYQNNLNDTRILYLRDDEDERLIKRLYKELDNPSCPLSNIPFFTHPLSNYEVSLFCTFAYFVTESLQISLREMCFTNDANKSGFSEEAITIIEPPTNTDYFETLLTIAHEERHAWQHIHYPEWFNNYIHPEDDVVSYRRQISEVDAEAYSIKFLEILYGKSFNYEYMFKDDPYLGELILKRMNEIDIVLSSKKVKKIRELINI